MNGESSSTADQFQPNDLIWAKMKGFPPWPARVIAINSDSPAGRVAVLFFGSRETAFVKPSDCSDYSSNRHHFEVPRKHKGFNEGVHEIRVAAGIEHPEYRVPVFFADHSNVEAQERQRSGRMLADAFFGEFQGGSTKSRASSTASARKNGRKQGKKSRWLGSESSDGSRRKAMISGGLDDKGIFDNFTAFDGADGWSLNHDGLLGMADDARSNRSKRSRGSSKVFEDLILGGLGRKRERSGSEGRRKRLISGVSDVFEDLFNGHLIHDEIPSENSQIFAPFMEQAGTPEAPALFPTPTEFCTKCGHECQLDGNRWRCSAKYCQEWNGVADVSQSMASSDVKPHPMDLDLKPVMKEEEKPPVMTSSKKGAVATNKPLVSTEKKGKEKKKPKIRIKREEESPAKKGKSARDRIREEFEKNDRQLASSATPKEEVVDPGQISLSPTLHTAKSPRRDKEGKRATVRSSQYKVEMTPRIMAKDGLRHCTFCDGQVRPQMCGGNKHRWRCVNKKCRKWYGWVRATEKMPPDMGLTGRPSRVFGKIKFKKEKEKPRRKPIPEEPTSAGEAAAAAAGLDTASQKSGTTGRSSPLKAAFLTLAGMKKQKAAEAQRLRQDSLAAAKNKVAKSLKRKHKKKEKREASVPSEVQDLPMRPLSPLTHREARFRPCAMEERARWWLSEKRRTEPSPERQLQPGAVEAAAAFRILSHAFRAAAVTRVDEAGSINGSLDLLMDSFLGSMGPLLSLLGKLPNTRPNSDVTQRLWDSSAVHIPIFQ